MFAKNFGMNSDLTLSEIWIYPIKSLGGIKLENSVVLPKGLKHDRRFMLVNEEGTALTQRTIPRLSLFKSNLINDRCEISYGSHAITIPLEPLTTEPAVRVKIWNDLVWANEVSSEYSRWFSQLLDIPCRLVFFPEKNSRPVDTRYHENFENVSLADAYPILIIGQESLNDLNRRLPNPLPMNRFRPNLVFTGGQSYAEDTFQYFTIGKNRFKAVKPCARCILITIDQETAAMGPEPLRTLSGYRKNNNKVYFGQNALIIEADEISCGEKILIETYR
jgi:uncharacterized protein